MTSPTVLDIEASEGQLLARVELGAVSVVVSAPEHVSEVELERALEEVPETVVEYAERIDPVESGDGLVTDGGRRWNPEPEGERCLACGSHVSRDFARVFGDEDGRVHRCRHCDVSGRLNNGSAAGKQTNRPDPQLVNPEEVDVEIDVSELETAHSTREGDNELVPDGGVRPEWVLEDIERELKRVLEHAEDDEARYHVREALQHLAVLEREVNER